MKTAVPKKLQSEKIETDRSRALKKHLLIAVLGLLGAIFIFGLWLKFSGPSALKDTALKLLPLPIMSVEGHFITSADFFERLQAADLAYSKQSAPSTDQIKSQIKTRLIYEKKLRILVQEKNAKLNGTKNFIEIPPKQNSAVKKAAEAKGYEEAVAFWFYSSRDLNAKTYKTADEIVKKLQDGEDFGNLAKKYSQDKDSLVFEGDLGPKTANSLLYELREPLMQAKFGQNLILASRLGVHIIQIYSKKVDESGQDVLYLKQIYLPGENFHEWIQNETKSYKVSNLINI